MDWKFKEKQLYNDLSKLFIDLKSLQDPTEKLPIWVTNVIHKVKCYMNLYKFPLD